jgi:hypothetical protein
MNSLPPFFFWFFSLLLGYCLSRGFGHPRSLQIGVFARIIWQLDI